jgi:hypothetical protein
MCIPPINIWMVESVLLNLGMYIMALQPIWMVLFHKFLLPSVCVSICIFPITLPGIELVNTFSRQRIHATLEELLDVSFFTRSILCQRMESVCLYLYPLQLLGNGSVNTPQRIHFGGVVLCVVPVMSEESRRFGTRNHCVDKGKQQFSSQRVS